jgi:hypothetical protein
VFSICSEQVNMIQHQDDRLFHATEESTSLTQMNLGKLTLVINKGSDVQSLQKEMQTNITIARHSMPLHPYLQQPQLVL